MRKSIWIAVALCAAVFALPVLAGCDNGEVTDEEIAGNGSTSGNNGGTSQGGTSGGDTGNTGNTGDSGNGGTTGGDGETSQGGTSGDDTGNTGNTGNVAQNLFKGKTIEYIYNKRYDNEDGSWEENYRKTSITFATDTTGIYVIEYRYSDSDSEQPDEGKSSYNIAYSLESMNGKNFLFIDVVDSAVDAEFDEYIKNYYQGISAETKRLLRKTYGELCCYYEFTDDNTVRITQDYYVGDMAKCNTSFSAREDASERNVYTYLYFSRESFDFYYSKTEYNNENEERIYTRKRYWGVPQFSNNAFTVTMYRNDETENGDETYVEIIGTLVGSYDIKGTGTKCDGMITFTQFPDEMKDLFAASYQIQNYDPQDDEDSHVYWQEYKIVTK